MRAIVVGEYRLYRGPDGNHYAESVFGRSFWNRYLQAFDEVVVVARVEFRNNVAGMLRVDGDGVSVLAMPYYVGVGGYVRNLPALRSKAKQVARLDGTVILRLPGAIGNLVEAALSGERAYGVELVGDPADVFGKGVVEHPLRKFMRIKAIRDLRRQCRRAEAVAYVSRHQLADRYPAGAGASTFAYSSATMPPEAFASSPRKYTTPLRHIIGIGSMEQTYKGFDILIDAFAALRQAKPELTLTLVGNGRYLGRLVDRAISLGVEESVTFIGALSTPAQVREKLDAGELFVSSSRTEGLPRTMIEAQARGLAVVGTRVGGTPELLEETDMCPADDVASLAELITRYLNDPVRATSNASRGWERAARYSEQRLQDQRNKMFSTLLSRGGK